VLAVPERARVYASATATDEIVAIDMTTLAIVARAPARHYPDGIAWAPTVGKLDVSDEHGHTVAVIDAALHQLKTKIPLGGDVGNTQYDAADGLIYSAGQSTNELVAIDPVRDAVVGRWPLPGCRGCGSASKAGPRLVMLRNSKTVSKAARVVEIGVGRNPQSICDSCFVPITCGRDGRGPALDADPHAGRKRSDLRIHPATVIYSACV
jgi:hypothetical protein